MPKIVDHDLYRRELLGKCFELFAHKGYASITMRQIAQELGVSTGTLYHYFPSKESLFLQLVEYLCEQDTSKQNLAQLGNPPTLAERIEAIFSFIERNQDYFLKQIFILIDFYRQQDDKEIYNSESFKRTKERYLQALGDYLKIQDRTTILLINLLFNGLLIEQLFEYQPIFSSQSVMLFKEILIDYLEKHSQEVN